MSTRFFMALACTLLIGGCTMSTPSQLRTGDIRLEESVATSTYQLADVGKSTLRAMAEDHAARGRGPVSVTVSFLEGREAEKIAAQAKMRTVAADMRAAGLAVGEISYVAVRDAAVAGQAVFSYPALIAQAPDHCTRMPGYQGAESLDAMQNYQITCESKAALAKMVARPADLLGTDGTGRGTARRAGAVVETYQDGEANELFYPPRAASDVGQ